jgi:uncharacterized coiled-coil DUF342 family protein
MNQITAIDLRLSALEQQLNAEKSEERKLIEKRNRLNDDFRKSRQEAQTLREERDNLNRKVQSLKILRDEIRLKTATIIEELRKVIDKIDSLKKETPKRKHSDLQREVDEIEWKIQTTSLEISEERQLIEEVRRLETQLQTYKRIEKLKKKAIEIENSLSALRTQADGFHQELNLTAQKSQETHAKMISKIAESKKMKTESDSLHLAYIQINEGARPTNNEYQQLAGQRTRLLEELKTEHESEQKGKRIELKERLISEAKSKLQQGKELSWDEFQLLNEEDTETQN